MSTTIESLQLEIEANSKSAVNGIDALTSSLEKLRNAAKGNLGLSSVSKQITSISTASASASRSFTDFYHKLTLGSKAIMVFGKKVWSAIEKSMDYTENLNLFSVSMGEFARDRVVDGELIEGAMTKAERFSEALGIDTSDWIRAQGVFMTMATGFGVAADRADVMSQNLTQLGYDLASFYNIDVETAMLKLKSGLAGELEPLRAIGYDLSQAKLEATALSLGITKSVSAMTQAEKAQLRYYAIMTQVTDAHNDMARTLNDPANQVRVLKAQFSMAAREIGNMFIPALNAILPVVTAVTKVVGILASIIAGLFGYEDGGLKETTSVVVENTDALTENLQDSQEEAKKLKSYMLGFDELNVINPNSGSEGEDSSGWVDFDLPKYDFLKNLSESRVNTIVEEMKKWLGITEDIDSWAELLDTKFGNILLSVGAIAGLLLTWRVTDGFLSTLDAIKKLGKVGSFSLGLVLVITGLVIGKEAIENALTEGLNGVNATALLGASGSIIAGGALIGKAFGHTLIGAAVSAILVGVVGLGVGLYDAIKNELNITNGLTIELSTILIGLGVAAMIPAITTGMGAIMGAVVGGAILGTTWLLQNTETTIEKIGAIVSGAALAVGAILAFSGINLPLGIALMAVGAVSMGTAIALNTNMLSDEVKGVIAIITTTVSLALLALGAILAFTGANIPLGIALMAGGAVTIATAILPNWNKLSTSVQKTISIIMAAVGGGLLALGAILAFSGAALPLGIALMVVGAASLGTAVALNWDAIVDALRGPVGLITGIIGGALLVLGAVLLFTGVGIPLGLGLILAGAAGLAAAIAPNWNTIVDKIKPVFASIMAIISGAMIVIGVLLLLSGAGIGLGLALIFGGLKGSQKAWEMDDNPITQFVRKMVNTIIGVLNKAISTINNVFDSIGLGGVINISLIPQFAGGGFPAQGQMFIAREAGAEMVGSIGRRTAVANNDQIVSGIAGGVAEANEEQNALLREQNTLLRALLEKENATYIDGKKVMESVEKHQRERGRVLIAGGVL